MHIPDIWLSVVLSVDTDLSVGFSLETKSIKSLCVV